MAAMNIRTHGFTLQELLFVLLTLSLLASYMYVDISKHFNRANLEVVVNDMHALREVALSYYAYHQEWPTKLEQLSTWLGEDMIVDQTNPLGFDYNFTVDSVGSDSEHIDRLQIMTAVTDKEQAQDLRTLMGVWAVVQNTSLSVSVLPPETLLTTSDEPYLLENNILMQDNAINNLGHIRLHGDGANTTLIVDRLFTYNFVTDRLYAKQFTEVTVFGPFITEGRFYTNGLYPGESPARQ